MYVLQIASCEREDYKDAYTYRYRGLYTFHRTRIVFSQDWKQLMHLFKKKKKTQTPTSPKKPLFVILSLRTLADHLFLSRSRVFICMMANRRAERNN